jgi:hypothetical protein
MNVTLSMQDLAKLDTFLSKAFSPSELEYLHKHPVFTQAVLKVTELENFEDVVLVGILLIRQRDELQRML